MISFPHAKINLGLNILNKLPNGYHTIETLFIPVSLKDILEVTICKNEKKDIWKNSGIIINDSFENNTIYRTLLKLRNAGYDIPPLSINLIKNIPFGAGLGGGSSNATFFLKIINQMFGLNFSDTEISVFMKSIGADCPFFAYSIPMLGEGIGDKLSPYFELPSSLKSTTLIIIKPKINISTQKAYNAIKEIKSPSLPLTETLKYPLKEWKNFISNDFEKALFPIYPELQKIKNSFYNAGAIYSSMSGSGSSFFGFFEKAPINLPKEWENCFIWKGSIIS